MTTILISGFFLGLVYGLLAVGLVVVYRGSRVINFAYGETGMIATFAFMEMWVNHHLPLAISVVAAVLLAAGIGAATDLVVIRPLRGEPPLTAMVGTLGVAALILAFAIRRYGVNPSFLPPLVEGTGFTVNGLEIQRSQLLVLLAAATVLGLLTLLYRASSFGLRLRATALDPAAAGLVGVNTALTSMATWALAGALAGLSGILVASSVSFSVFFMTSLLLRSLAAALVGGLTSIGGGFVAGVTLGLTEALIGYLAPVTGVVEVLLAAFVIGLLLVRPAGLVRSAY
jgi:branched-chain amino acid transport system permease protein